MFFLALGAVRLHVGCVDKSANNTHEKLPGRVTSIGCHTAPSTFLNNPFPPERTDTDDDDAFLPRDFIGVSVYTRKTFRHI